MADLAINHAQVKVLADAIPLALVNEVGASVAAESDFTWLAGVYEQKGDPVSSIIWLALSYMGLIYPKYESWLKLRAATFGAVVQSGTGLLNTNYRRNEAEDRTPVNWYPVANQLKTKTDNVDLKALVMLDTLYAGADLIIPQLDLTIPFQLGKIVYFDADLDYFWTQHQQSEPRYLDLAMVRRF